MKAKITFILTAFIFVYCAYPAFAATWNVPGDSATIQGAIDAASYGDTIYVAAGTYVELITLKNGVALVGAGASTTTINGNAAGSVVTSTGCDPNTVLQGFTIANGASDGGGGMFNYNSSPTVTGCTFSGNTAAVCGGMYNDNSSPTVTDCTFSGNSADIEGGGMYNWTSSPTVTGCTFSGNSATQGGGGMYNVSSSPTVTGCTFSGNSAGYGGGMRNSDCSPAVTGCTFSGNSAGYSGGAMYNVSSSPTVTDCTFIGNSAGSYGGGMCNNNNSSPTVTNCILWDDSPDEILNSNSTPIVNYSDIQGGYTGTDNINADPNFIDVLGGNLRLAPGSPCIDAGDNTAVPAGVTTDLDGNPRFVDDPATVDTGNGTPPIVDMGAFEFGSVPYLLWPNGGEILPVGGTCTISWQSLLPVSDVVIEYSTGNVTDFFDSNNESGFVFEDGAGSFLIFDGKLNITTGSSNTASVMTSQTVRFDVGQTLSLDVPGIDSSDGEGVFMMCSTIAGSPDGTSSYGFRFRRAGDYFRVDLLPGGNTAHTDDKTPAEPTTLKVTRVSDIFFVYSITIDGTEHHLGSFTLSQLASFTDLHVGAQAFDVTSDTFVFDNLRVYNSADGPAQWQTAWPPNQGNTGSYDWVVPDVLSETCLVRISPAGNLSQSDTSDDFFSIAGLAAHWKLDETGGYTAYDSAGGNDGSLYGDPQRQPVGGQTGGALQLDGVDDYIDCDNEAVLNITDQLTLAAWVKTGDCENGEFNPYITKGDFTYGLKHNDANNIEFMTYIDDYWYTAEYSVDSSFNDQWHHLAGTYDGSDLTLYIDGDFVASTHHPGTINTTTEPVCIGSNAYYSKRLYEGLIDDVRIYNYALSADEIRQLLCLEPMKGDLDNNCRTDLADMALWAADWMRCGMAFEDLCRP